jgi:hypothetical protein
MLIIGRHTFDILAEVIQSIIDDYDIESKQLSVVTDNGSNFVKAFRMFPPRDTGSEPDTDSDDEGKCYFIFAVLFKHLSFFTLVFK